MRAHTLASVADLDRGEVGGVLARREVQRRHVGTSPPHGNTVRYPLADEFVEMKFSITADASSAFARPATGSNERISPAANAARGPPIRFGCRRHDGRCRVAATRSG